MKIEVVELKEITPYYDNPRNNANAVPPVMESIKRFGFIKPIIVDQEHVIISGHTRYIAAFQLGLNKVPIIVSDMDDEHAKMFRIADNKSSEKSEYDEQELIEELKNLGVPSEMQAFFFENIDSMLNFSFDSINQQMEENGYNGYENGEFVPASNSFDPNDTSDEEDFEDEQSQEEVDEEEEVDPAEGLFQVRIIDGKRMMKVVCPYCGNIEMRQLD